MLFLNRLYYNRFEGKKIIARYYENEVRIWAAGTKGEIMDYKYLLQIEENAYTIDELLKAYYEFFPTPMVVIDQNYEIKGQFYIEDVDETFLENVKRGSWSVELISLANSFFRNGENYQIVDTINNEVRRLFYRLTYNDTILGYLVLLESKKIRFEDLDSVLLEHLAKSLTKLLRLQSKEGYGFSQLSFWKALINHTYVRKDIFLSKAAEFKIPLTYNYRILLLSLDKYDNRQDSHLQASLKAILRNFYLIVKENYVILILDKDLSETTVSALNDFLFENHIYAILSSKIIYLYELDVIIDNLIKLFSYLIEVSDEYCLKYEEENKLLVPLFNAPNNDVILNYINETVLDIYIYDKKNNTAMLDTMYQYLLNNKSLQETSKILFVHKNTVMYRLEKVKDLFNITFDNVNNNLSYMYSIVVIRYLESIHCKALADFV